VGVCAKKIRGKSRYFGPWSNAAAARKKYLDQRDDLQAGRNPRGQGDGLNIRGLCNRFLTSKQHLIATGELAQRSFRYDHASCEIIIKACSARLASWSQLPRMISRSSAQAWPSPAARGAREPDRHVPMVFKYSYAAGHIDRPIRFGPMFRILLKKMLRKTRHAIGPRIFEAAEFRCVLKTVDHPPVICHPQFDDGFQTEMPDMSRQNRSTVLTETR
jgi:hypothetical protein